MSVGDAPSSSDPHATSHATSNAPPAQPAPHAGHDAAAGGYGGGNYGGGSYGGHHAAYGPPAVPEERKRSREGEGEQTSHTYARTH